MGAALELGKITATVWLHRFWHRASIQFKLYLIPAIVILMIITSMGIFGFLSKAHMDQTVTVGDSAAQVAILDEKIATEKSNIDSAKRALTQMDSQVDQMLSRTTDDKGTNRAVQIRKQQAGERKNLQREITQAQQNISKLQNERAPLAAQTRKIEAEVGPVKYIAALIYGDNPDANLLERAVRWVIILLVLVFDPLALVLILAAEQTIEWARTDRKAKKAQDDAREGWHQEWVPNTENPWYEPDDGPLTDEQVTKITQEAKVNNDIEMTKFFEEGKELAKSIDDNDGFVVKQHHNPKSVNDVDLDIPVLENEETWAQRVIDEATETQATFGSEELMPKNPQKGDMFMRTDVIPNVLFKWNGLKWIEIPMTSTDSYVYNPEYIQDLIDRIAKGKYTIDLVTIAEQDQIQQVLHEQSKQ
jgi:sugar-specific transcriptional regulator TrmB